MNNIYEMLQDTETNLSMTLLLKSEMTETICLCWKILKLPSREGGRGTDITTLPVTKS